MRPTRSGNRGSSRCRPPTTTSPVSTAAPARPVSCPSPSSSSSPGRPCRMIYYGDEIGMRYVPGLPEKEGSVLGPRYNRAGSRTPMQWDEGPNAGFSTAPSDRLYLPLDPSPDRPTVAAQRADDTSLLHLVRRLVALRTGTPELGPWLGRGGARRIPVRVRAGRPVPRRGQPASGTGELCRRVGHRPPLAGIGRCRDRQPAR